MTEYRIVVNGKRSHMYPRGFFGKKGRKEAQRLIDSGLCAHCWCDDDGETPVFKVKRVPFRLYLPDWGYTVLLGVLIVVAVAWVWVWVVGQVPPDQQAETVAWMLVGFVLWKILSK